LKHAVGIVEDGLNVGVKALIDFTDVLFLIKKVVFQAGSTQGLAKGETAEMSVTCNLLGHTKTFSVHFTFPPTFDHLLHGVWSTIKADLHL